MTDRDRAYARVERYLLDAGEKPEVASALAGAIASAAYATAMVNTLGENLSAVDYVERWLTTKPTVELYG